MVNTVARSVFDCKNFYWHINILLIQTEILVNIRHGLFLIKIILYFILRLETPLGVCTYVHRNRG